MQFITCQSWPFGIQCVQQEDWKKQICSLIFLYFSPLREKAKINLVLLSGIDAVDAATSSSYLN